MHLAERGRGLFVYALSQQMVSKRRLVTFLLNKYFRL